MAAWLCQIFASDRGSLHLNALAGRWFPANIAICDISLKTRFFGLHFTRRTCRYIFNHFYVIGPKSYRIRRNNANAVQGHSRLPILVPIKSPYATFYQWLTVTYLLSCAVSKLWPIIGRIFTSDKGVPFNAPAGGNPLRISRQTLPLQKLEGLSYQMLKTARSYLHSCGHNTGTW